MKSVGTGKGPSNGPQFRCVFVDTETTGLDPQNDRILSYSLRTWDLWEGAGLGVQGLVLPPFGLVTAEAARVNGYQEEMWVAQGARPFDAEHAGHIADMLPDKCMVAGSNPRFDIDFFKAEFARINVAFPRVHHRMIDTSSMAIPLLVAGHVHGTGLDALRQYFGIDQTYAHTAAGDVETSIEVFEALLAAYLIKEGPDAPR